MKPAASRAVPFLIAIALLAPARSSAQTKAQDAATAEALFVEAQKLVEEKKYAEACPKFERSEQLDPGVGNEINLADCYEHVGKISSAWSMFKVAAGNAIQKGQNQRADYAEKRAKALEARLPRLVIRVDPGVARTSGLTVRRNGAPLERPEWGSRLPVDPGEHVIEATAPQKKPWKKTVEAREGVTATVDVDILHDLPPPEMLQSAWSPRRIGAVTAGAIGLAGIAVGAVTGGIALAKGGQAKVGCDEPAPGTTLWKNCPPGAESVHAQAFTFSVVSTVTFIAGGVGAATGLILWLTDPRAPTPTRTAWRVVPVVSANGFGTVVQGGF